MTTSTIKLIEGAVIFLAGAAAGALGAYTFFKAKYIILAAEKEEEVESVKEAFGRKLDEISAGNKRSVENRREDGYEDGLREAHAVYNNYSTLTRDYSRVKNVNKLSIEDMTLDEFELERMAREREYAEWKRIYKKRPVHEPIHDESGHEEWDKLFDEVDWYWYEGNDVFVEDGSDEPVENPTTYIGTYARGYLADSDAEVVSVRNNELEIIYTIYKVHDRYHGDDFDDDEDAEKEIGPGGETPRERMQRLTRKNKITAARERDLEEGDDEDDEDV